MVHTDIKWVPPGLQTHAGIHECERYEFCTFMNEGDLLVLPMARSLRYKQRAKCNTMMMGYVILCVCELFYIDKKICTVRKRLQDHLYEILMYHLKFPLARHKCLEHNRDPRSLKCQVLEVIPGVLGGRLQHLGPLT